MCRSAVSQYGTVRYGTVHYSTVPYRVVQYGKDVRYSTGTTSYGTLMYGTIPYGSVPKQYGTVKGDTWITKGNVIPRLIRSFELSKNLQED